VKSATSRSASRMAGFAPLLRVSLLAAVGGALMCALLLRNARAQLDEAMLGLGSRAMAFPGAPISDARTLRINGVDVHLRTEAVDAPLPHVLRHYRNVCASPHPGSGDYAAFIASLATRSRSTDRDGYVACVETRAGDIESLAERLVRFSKTWDLADVGPLRYAYATRASERPDEQTFLLTMWADASIELRDLLPLGTSDAKGTDLLDVPRPPSSQRILSATEVSAPSGVYVYLTHGVRGSELTQVYRRALSQRGWNILERNPHESIEVDDVLILSAEKGGRTLSVLVRAEAASPAVVTLLVSELE
jgi:hypothetical protein